MIQIAIFISWHCNKFSQYDICEFIKDTLKIVTIFIFQREFFKIFKVKY